MEKGVGEPASLTAGCALGTITGTNTWRFGPTVEESRSRGRGEGGRSVPSVDLGVERRVPSEEPAKEVSGPRAVGLGAEGGHGWHGADARGASCPKWWNATRCRSKAQDEPGR